MCLHCKRHSWTFFFRNWSLKKKQKTNIQNPVLQNGIKNNLQLPSWIWWSDIHSLSHIMARSVKPINHSAQLQLTLHRLVWYQQHFVSKMVNLMPCLYVQPLSLAVCWPVQVYMQCWPWQVILFVSNTTRTSWLEMLPQLCCHNYFHFLQESFNRKQMCWSSSKLNLVNQ